jgi:hypothetical protein
VFEAVVLLPSPEVRMLAGNRRAMVLAVVLSAGVVGVGGGASAAAPDAVKRMSVREHVTLKLVKRIGSSTFEHAGRATGTVDGTVTSRSTMSHSVLLRGMVTITTSKGRLRLRIDGRARSLELRTRFNGTATIAGGTGRYRHAQGRGTFDGIVNRSTWAATIDARGSFTY